MSKKYYATRDFNDAGTGRAFTADAEVNATDGELGNYLAAGLVTDEKPGAGKSEATTGTPAAVTPTKPAT